MNTTDKPTSKPAVTDKPADLTPGETATLQGVALVPLPQLVDKATGDWSGDITVDVRTANKLHKAAFLARAGNVSPSQAAKQAATLYRAMLAEVLAEECDSDVLRRACGKGAKVK